jgi:hypothetical protein
MDLYEKELVGHSRTDMVYLLRPVTEARGFMVALRLLKVERKKAWSRLDYEDRKDRS